MTKYKIKGNYCFAFQLFADNIQKIVDSKNVEHEDGIELNIILREAQTSQNVLCRSLMVSALSQREINHSKL